MSVEAASQPVAAPPAPGGERVHFSRSPGRPTKLARRGLQLWQSAVVVAVVVPAFAAFSTGLFGGNSWVFIGAIAVVVGLPWALHFIGWITWRRRTADLHTQPDPTCRLCVIGRPEEVLAFGPLDDVSFEPVVLRSLASTSSAVQWVASAPFFVGAVLLLVRPDLLNAVAPLFGNSAGFITIMVCVIGLGIGAAVAAGWFFPTYYRIVPGRLDVMGYSPLSRKARLLRSIDLRSARLLVNMRHWTVRIDSDGAADEILIRFMPGRRRFAHAILLAAISTAPTPDMPDNELIG